MADKVQERLLTADDLLALPDDGTKRYELIEGQLITMSPTGEMHGHVAARLLIRIGVFVEQHRLGRVYAAETGFKVGENPDTVFGIDVSFVSTVRLQTRDGYILGAPDLAVEVMSKNNRAGEMRKKSAACFKAGCKLFWVVYPKSRRIRVYRADGTVQILSKTDILSGEGILPGFSVKVAEIFAVLDE